MNIVSIVLVCLISFVVSAVTVSIGGTSLITVSVLIRHLWGIFQWRICYSFKLCPYINLWPELSPGCFYYKNIQYIFLFGCLYGFFLSRLN